MGKPINLLAIIGENTVQKIDLAVSGGMMFGFRTPSRTYDELPSPSSYSIDTQWFRFCHRRERCGESLAKADQQRDQ
jgi:hypothetical protein